MVVQPGLCGTWSETPKTGFLTTRLIYWFYRQNDYIAKFRQRKKTISEFKTELKIMESGINLDVLKKSGKYPCGVCLTDVGSTNAILFGGCERWVHKKCRGIKRCLLLDSEFRCA